MQLIKKPKRQRHGRMGKQAAVTQHQKIESQREKKKVKGYLPERGCRRSSGGEAAGLVKRWRSSLGCGGTFWCLGQLAPCARACKNRVCIESVPWTSLRPRTRILAASLFFLLLFRNEGILRDTHFPECLRVSTVTVLF